MIDRDVVDRFHRAVGVGRVGAERRLTAGGHTMWRWYLYRTDEVLALLDRMEPMLGERRRKQAAVLRRAV